MSASKTLAFVLGSQDYRDTSLIAHLYTRDFGKVRGVVRGIRDARARFGSTLEPFSLNEILFYKRRRGASDLHQVTQADLSDSFDAIREDLERLSYASYFMELVNEIADVEDPHPAVFDLIHDTLGFLASGASPKRVARVFEVKLLEEMGLLPEWGECVVCRAQAPEPAYFNASIGGIRCKACAAQRGSTQEHEQTLAVGMPISRGTILFLKHVLRAPVKELQNVKVAGEVGEEVEKALRRFLDFHLGKKLKTMVFLDKMGY